MTAFPLLCNILKLDLIGKTVHARTTEVRSGSPHPAGLPHEFPRLFSVVNAPSYSKLLFLIKVTARIRDKLVGLGFTDPFSSWPLKKLE